MRNSEDTVFIRKSDENLNDLKIRIFNYTALCLKANNKYPSYISLDKEDYERLLEDEVSVVDNGKILGMKVRTRDEKFRRIKKTTSKTWR